MARRFFIFALIVFALGINAVPSVLGEHPTTLTHYRFLPRFSVLNQSGGIAGSSVDFRVLGTFDLAIDNDHEDPWGNSATFENVDAWAAHPILAYVLNLNDVLGLERLVGEQLPVAGPYDAYRFMGKTQDGSSVDLFASVIGPWLRLTGETTPPPDGADYFTYRIDALARSRPFADFNDDGVVDREDLARWGAHFGDSTSTGIDVTDWGDADGDGDVDGRDFLAWQRQAGEVAPALTALETMSAIPEPGTLLLAGWAMSFVFGRRVH